MINISFSGLKGNNRINAITSLVSHEAIISFGNAMAFYAAFINQALLLSVILPQTHCPFCGALGCFAAFRQYSRITRDFDEISADGDRQSSALGRYRVYKVQCACCGHWHTLLSQLSPPYCRYSYGTICSTLHEYYTGANISKLCSAASFCRSTFYAWKAVFEQDLTVFMDIDPENLTKDMCTRFLHFLEQTDFDQFLKVFASVTGRQFLQLHKNPQVIRKSDEEGETIMSTYVQREVAKYVQGLSQKPEIRDLKSMIEENRPPVECMAYCRGQEDLLPKSLVNIVFTSSRIKQKTSFLDIQEAYFLCLEHRVMLYVPEYSSPGSHRQPEGFTDDSSFNDPSSALMFAAYGALLLGSMILREAARESGLPCGNRKRMRC